jgi:glycosyltransferase involved in cell wall biosynthesis
MKIAWFTPFSRKSAIGKYSAIILDELTRSHQVRVFAGDLTDAAESWRPRMSVESVAGRGGKPDLVDRLAEYDVAVYNLGNFVPFHRDVYATQLAHPGIVVLHDLVMHDFFTNLYLARGCDHHQFVEHLAFSHGKAGQTLGRGIVSHRRDPVGGDRESLRYPLIRSAIHHALGVLVHGEFVRRQVAAVASVPVIKIDFPTPPITAVPQTSSSPAKFSRVHLLTFGLVNPNKKSDLVIEAIGKSELLRRRVLYTIVGECHSPTYLKKLRELIASYHLEDVVRMVGHKSDADLETLIHQADVIINLRNPHFGECSWSLLEALFAGKPTLVWAHGYYDEFPADVVKKVSSARGLRQALEDLAGDPEGRAQLSQRARAHAVDRFSTTRFCERFVSFVEACRSNRPVLDLLDSLAEDLRDLTGGATEGRLVDVVSREVSDLFEAA